MGRTTKRAGMFLVSLASGFAQSDSASISQWVKANAIPLTTVEAGHGFDDMQPLKKIVGNARIVSLGEATHGTREFFQLKHRMVEFLATQMGFTIFSIEANMPEAYALNDYVLNGRGNAAQLLKGMYFWTWNTKEVLAMIEWMREFNKSGKGRIEFTGFDMQTPEVAGQIVRDFADKYDPDYLPAIQKSPYARRGPEAARPFASDTGSFPIEEAAGKTIRFSANIKTQDVIDYAGLWWRADAKVDGAFKTLAFQNLHDDAPKGTTDWKHYELEMAVPAETKNINFGVLLSGGGTAWFDGLAVEIDGKPYTKAHGFDLTHGVKALPQGSFSLVPGYTASFASKESSGAPGPSLQLKRIAPVNEAADSAAANQPHEAAAAWRQVLDHLESSKAAYVAKGASTKDADWAIQNARVVLQSAQMNAKEITRDRAMADNVKWILDHSPKETKIVLWAHNGHVMTRTPYKEKSMGAELRAMYGDAMVVFGFAFNQGSFQSIEMNKGLRNFTVPPAPAGSFDSTLAASGIPLFALDLRRGSSAPVGPWLQEAHKSRSIGSMYAEDRADQFFMDLVPRSSFDAILYVENTNAAVPNPPLPGPSIMTCGSVGTSQACHDKEYAVSVRLPAGWTMDSGWRWGDKESTVAFKDPQAVPGQRNPSLYYRMRPTPLKRTSEQTLAALQTGAEHKVVQRQGTGLADYHLRPDSCRSRTVGGLPALSCICEFTDASGTAMAEYLTWIDGENAGAEFFGFIPASALDGYRPRFDEIIETLKIP